MLDLIVFFCIISIMLFVLMHAQLEVTEVSKVFKLWRQKKSVSSGYKAASTHAFWLAL